MMSTVLRAIIFDFDGVIADTEPLHYRAFAAVLNGTPWAISENEYFSRYLGLTDKAMLEKLKVDRATPFVTGQLAELLQKKYQAYLDMITGGMALTPGLLEFLMTVPPECLLAICSGARRREIELILQQNDLRERFQTIVSSEDVHTSKPDPTGYRLAFEQLQSSLPSLLPNETLAIEDSPLGISAARAAGLRTMGIKPAGSIVDIRLAEECFEDFSGIDFANLRRHFAEDFEH